MAIFVSNPEERARIIPSLNESAGGEAATVSGSAGSAVAEPADSPSMAEPVTRHALMPPAQDFQYLLCGFDSLDIGLFVEWGDNWPVVLRTLQQLKDHAKKLGEVVEETNLGRNYVIFPNGKGDNYAFHLQFPEYHLFIAKSEKFSSSPNVYLSINSRTMWGKGIAYALDLAAKDVKYFGGKIVEVLPSRLDLCADFKLSPGLSLPFLEEHAVCRSRDVRPIIKAGILETCYFGAPAAEIRIRIYNKGKEVLKKGEKLWLADMWGTDDFQDIWRVEFQLRRAALKEFKINDFPDLWRRAGGLWKYLTEDWFSLRSLDNDRQNRRSIHPWWLEVQHCADRFGNGQHITRDFSTGAQASALFYIAHIAGCLPAFAARTGTRDYKDAILTLGKALYEHWSRRDFDKEFIKRSIKLGHAVAIGGDCHE